MLDNQSTIDEFVKLVAHEKYPMSESIHVHTLDIRSHMDKSGQ